MKNVVGKTRKTEFIKSKNSAREENHLANRAATAAAAAAKTL